MHKILIVFLFIFNFSLDGNASKNCANLFKNESQQRTLNKAELNAETLSSLVGAEVKIFSSWPGTKVDGSKREVEATGLVQAVYLTTKDKNPTISIRLQMTDGKMLTFEHFANGADVLSVSVIQTSKLDNFIKTNNENGWTTRVSKFFESLDGLARDLRKHNANYEIKVLYIQKGQVIEALGAIKKIPSDIEIALATPGEAPPYIFTLNGKDVPLSKEMILAVGYHP